MHASVNARSLHALITLQILLVGYFSCYLAVFKLKTTVYNNSSGWSWKSLTMTLMWRGHLNSARDGWACGTTAGRRGAGARAGAA